MQKYLQNCFFESIFPSNHTFESAHKQRRGCIFTNLSTAMRANVLTDEHTETCWINGVALHITAPNRHPERDKKNVSFWSRFVFLSKERRQVLVEGNMCDFHYSVQSGFIFFLQYLLELCRHTTVCYGLASVVRLLLKIYWANFNQIWYVAST